MPEEKREAETRTIVLPDLPFLLFALVFLSFLAGPEMAKTSHLFIFETGEDYSLSFLLLTGSLIMAKFKFVFEFNVTYLFDT